MGFPIEYRLVIPSQSADDILEIKLLLSIPFDETPANEPNQLSRRTSCGDITACDTVAVLSPSWQ
jgi:hypothetical protein